jgi:hypothetical protein
MRNFLFLTITMTTVLNSRINNMMMSMMMISLRRSFYNTMGSGQADGAKFDQH